jgi:hypothetical protein
MAAVPVGRLKRKTHPEAQARKDAVQDITEGVVRQLLSDEPKRVEPTASAAAENTAHAAMQRELAAALGEDYDELVEMMMCALRLGNNDNSARERGGGGSDDDAADSMDSTTAGSAV